MLSDTPLRSELAQHVLRWVQYRDLPRAGERVGVAVSGGADSVALLLLLLELRKKLGIVISVAHLNHKLRGRASDADEKFVAKLAAAHGLVFYVDRVDVRKIAQQKKANLEDTARRERYAFFRRLVDEGHLDWIAVAHTAEDQAETVLAHIFRGTGLAGLGGIYPIVGRVFRPLLAAHRADLRTYLRAKKAPWREDATNRDATKTRARIRHKLLPVLEKQFSRGVVDHLGTLAELARNDEALLEQLTRERYRALVRTREGKSSITDADLIEPLGAKGFATEHAEFAEKSERALSGRLVRLIVEEVKSRAGQINAGHVRSILNLAQDSANGKTLHLPGGVCVRREHDTLVFWAQGGEKSNEREESTGFEYAIELCEKETVVRVAELGCAFRFMTIDWPEKTGDTRYTGSALDRDALRSPLVLRNWRPGDQLHPIGHRNTHKLKRLLSKKRVDRWERKGWPILTSGGVLAWARGFPVAAEFAAQERTRAGIVIVEEEIS